MGQAEAKTILREADVRVTKPRILILGYLLDNLIHPTCDQIYSVLKDENPSLSLASVYNVTEKLAEEKIIRLVTTPDGIKHYDSNMDFHSHFYCLTCERLYDVECDPDSLKLHFPGSVPVSYDLMTRGYCPSCVKRKKQG